MSTAESIRDIDRDTLKRAAAAAAVELVTQDMVVGLGSGSTAAFAIEMLARRYRQGLRFVGIPTSDLTAAQAAAAGIPLTPRHQQAPSCEGLWQSAARIAAHVSATPRHPGDSRTALVTLRAICRLLN